MPSKTEALEIVKIIMSVNLLSNSILLMFIIFNVGTCFLFDLRSFNAVKDKVLILKWNGMIQLRCSLFYKHF